MARHTRIQVAQTMAATGLVPLAYHPDAAVMKQIVSACFNGGATLTVSGWFAQYSVT